MFDKTSQIKELQTLLKIKTKELELLKERKSCPFCNYSFKILFSFIEVQSLQIKVVDKTSQTDELQSTVENNEVHLEELQMQRERIRELEVTIQEITSPQNSNDIISLQG